MISVIVPCYNGQDYLLPCLQSVEQQTDSNWEVILVNDGSTDRSLAIAEDFQKQMTQPQRLVILSQENKGLSAARNAGLRQAKGDYIFFLDCDDWIEEQALEKLRQAMEREAETDFAWMGFQTLYEQTGRIRRYRYPYLLNEKTVDGKAFFMTFLANKYMIAMGNGLYRKTLLDARGIVFQESMKRGEDVQFEMEVFMACRKVAATAYRGFTYRLHGQSMVHEPREKVIQELLLNKKRMFARGQWIETNHSRRAALLYEVVFANVFVYCLGLKEPYRRRTIFSAFAYWLVHPILRRQVLRDNCKLWLRSWQER